jgi:hypothetical protein
MCIRKVLLDKSMDIIHLCLSFVQKWKILMNELERNKVEALVSLILQHIKNFRPLTSHPSNVGLI